MAGSSGALSLRSSKSTEEIEAAYDDAEAADYAESHWLKRRIERRSRRHQFGDVTIGGRDKELTPRAE